MSKQNSKLYKRWYFWVAIVIVTCIIVIFVLLFSKQTQKVTICTQMDYSRGDFGPCTEKKTVEIVSSPNNASECPSNTEPVFDVVGGIVGVRFIGCAKK